MNQNTIRCSGLLLTLLSSYCGAATTAAPAPVAPSSSFPSLSTLKHGHTIVQLGGYWSEQGKAQHININGLIGDNFTLAHSDSSNGLVGLGYFVDGQEKERFKMSYGINGFYLGKT